MVLFHFFSYKHVLNYIPLAHSHLKILFLAWLKPSLRVAKGVSNQATLVIFWDWTLKLRWFLIAQSMIPGWRTLRSMLKPCKKQTRNQFVPRNWYKECNLKHVFAVRWYLCTVRTTRLPQNNQARSICIIKSNALQSLHQTFRTWCNDRLGRLTVAGTYREKNPKQNHVHVMLLSRGV